MHNLIKTAMLLSVLVAGCGSIESRTLTGACGGYLNLDQINSAIHGLAAEYIDGVPYSTQIYAVQDFCGRDADCLNCLFAIVDVVYSQ